MKGKSIKKIFAGLLAVILCTGMFTDSVYAMTVSGTTFLDEKMVIVTASDVETVVNESDSKLKAILPVKDTTKQEISWQEWDDPESVNVTGTAPEGYPYQLVGDGELSNQWYSKVYVTYEKDENNKPKKDNDGNYIIESLKSYRSTGKVLTSRGIPTTDLGALFDQKTGARMQQNLLKDVEGNCVYTYCVDMETNTKDRTWYAISNIEDQGYFASQIAVGKIRAIVLNGYWGSASGIGSLDFVKKNLKDALKTEQIKKEYEFSYWKNNNGGAEDEIVTEIVSLTEEIIDALTAGEALDMTQAAIWSYSNGAQSVRDGKDGLTISGVTYGDTAWGNEETHKDDPHGAARMMALYEWLTGLEPQAAKSVVIDENNFIEELKLVVNEDDNIEDNIYDVDLQFTLAATPAANDDLVLAIKYDDKKIDVRLAGKNDPDEDYETLLPENGVYTISDLSLTENELFDIEMQITGKQELVQDAYMYLPQGGIKKSQAMVGIAEGTRTVDVSMSAEVCFNLEDYKERIISINKKTMVGETQIALEGIEFDMYYVGTLDEFTENYNDYVTVEKVLDQNGEPIVVDGKETVKEVVSDAVMDNLDDYTLITTLTTGKNGYASYNLTENGQPDGIYLFVEKSHDATKKPIDPFYVTVPMTSEDGMTKEYIIDMIPKNDVIDGPEIRKDVTEIENNLDSVDVNEEHTWIIRTDIPVDLGAGKEYMNYVINDTLDHRLSLKYVENKEAEEGESTREVDLVVKVSTDKDAAANTESAANVLKKGTHYTITSGTKTVKVGEGEAAVDETVDTFTIELTTAGMAKVAKIANGNYADSEIRVYFKAVIDEDAALGELIPNEATLGYTNSLNFHYDEKSDKPEVYTCGINIKKYDAKDTKKFLDGAEFMLARKATQAELADDTVETSTLVIGRGQTEEVVYVDFYNNAKLTGPKVQSVLTDKEGDAMIYGIKELFETDADGNLVKDDEGNPVTAKYYLVETKAPEGYNLLSYPVEVIVNRNSHVTDNPATEDVNEDMTVRVANSNRFELPSTGGIGTTIFTLVGAALVLGSGAVLVGKKRKEEVEETEE